MMCQVQAQENLIFNLNILGIKKNTWKSLPRPLEREWSLMGLSPLTNMSGLLNMTLTEWYVLDLLLITLKQEYVMDILPVALKN